MDISLVRDGLDQYLPVPPVPSMSCLLVPLLAAGALADYPYYTDYTDYNSVYAPAAVANLSRLSRATKNQRTWDPSGPFTVTLEPSISIPLPDLDSSLLLELPITWEFGGDAARRGGHFQGRSAKKGNSLQTMDTI